MSFQDQDRVGLGWRPELAAGIFAHLEQIDVVEVIAEDWFAAPRHKAAALRTLTSQVPVQLHGTSAGLASSFSVDEERLAKMARLVEIVQPESWSEHLAFVRAGNIELGHLAAVPRTITTIDRVATNVDRARKIVGLTPDMENIATLIDPPASSMSEVEWLRSVAKAADAPLLLDLHNLHANTSNFGGDAMETLRMLPLERVRTVHIAGGRWITSGPQQRVQRLLDDHLHPVPDIVYQMLEELAATTPQPLTVVLERDGAFPAMQALLLELDLARSALRRGRARSKPTTIIAGGTSRETRIDLRPDESEVLETFLANIYVDGELRSRFLSDPVEIAQLLGLCDSTAAKLAQIDRVGLEMAAASLRRKRRLKNVAGNGSSWARRSAARIRQTLVQALRH